jgi:methanol--5-hydroxybenzimidazolylcobamide Co-methyltransferase
MLCPDNAWSIGKAITENHGSYYERAKAAATTCAALMLADPELVFTAFEKESLLGYLEQLRDLPAQEEDFIDLCLSKYRTVKGFRPAAYGL